MVEQIHSHFRILRGPVFKRYFKDNTRWWGWCDTDVGRSSPFFHVLHPLTFKQADEQPFRAVLGNFKRMVPWDHIKDFDIVQPTHTTPAKEILLYMRFVPTPFPPTPPIGHS